MRIYFLSLDGYIPAAGRSLLTVLDFARKHAKNMGVGLPGWSCQAWLPMPISPLAAGASLAAGGGAGALGFGSFHRGVLGLLGHSGRF